MLNQYAIIENIRNTEKWSVLYFSQQLIKRSLDSACHVPYDMQQAPSQSFQHFALLTSWKFLYCEDFCWFFPWDILILLVTSTVSFW